MGWSPVVFYFWYNASWVYKVRYFIEDTNTTSIIFRARGAVLMWLVQSLRDNRLFQAGGDELNKFMSDMKSYMLKL